MVHYPMIQSPFQHHSVGKQPNFNGLKQGLQKDEINTNPAKCGYFEERCRPYFTSGVFEPATTVYTERRLTNSSESGEGEG